jgi:hypothetical protein
MTDPEPDGPPPADAPAARVEAIDDASRGLEACGDLFRADPIGSSPVTITLYPGRSSELLRVHHEGRTIGAAVSEATGTDAASYTLTPLGPGAAVALADELPIDRQIRLAGPPSDVAMVAGRWSDRCNGAVDTGGLFRWYRLRTLDDGRRHRKGRLDVASSDSIERAVDWLMAFADDVELPITRDIAAIRIGDAVNEGRLMEWRVGDEVVSQLMVSPVRFGVVRINGVYTPPALRKDGHSGAITAAVAAEQIARQKVDEIVLDQPASNAATNRMYRRLGFESVADALVVRLVPR